MSDQVKEGGNISNQGLHVSNQSGKSKLYTIVLYLTGQQASGVQALINLQCRAHSLNLPMIILEPVIPRNKFKAMPPIRFDESGEPLLNQPRRDTILRFGDLFNLEHFNRVSGDLSYPQLAPRDDFFKSAPRNIIFVLLYEGEKNELPELTRLWPEHSSGLTGGCFDPLKSQLGFDPKYQLYEIVQKGFCVVEVVVFRITRGETLIFTEAQLKRTILGGFSYSEITLVFNIWMPKFVLPGSKGRECIHAGYRSTKDQVQPSKQLLASANYYESHFLDSDSNQLTLMIRLEHIYTYLRRPRSQYGEWTVEKCLNAAVKEVRDFQSRRSFGKPFVTLDIGKYGSKTVRSIGTDHLRNDTRHINALLSSLYDGQWNIREWEESFIEASGGIEDSSYIAALQRTLASRAECLILVGGGMFQELTMKKYMETHEQEDWCVHFLCIKDRLDSQLP